MAITFHSVSNKVKQGFTLLELMIAVAIIGILAAIAVPSYINYMFKARVSDLIQAAAPYQLAVAEYYMTNGSMTGYAGVPAANTVTDANIAKLIVDPTGAIIISGTAKTGSAANGPTTILLTPKFDANANIIWNCSVQPPANQIYAPQCQ